MSKKYPSLENDVDVVTAELENNPEFGQPLGKGRFKIRVAIKSKSAGKSGGGRLIALVQKVNDKIILLAIYDKSDRDTISDKELDAIVSSIP